MEKEEHLQRHSSYLIFTEMIGKSSTICLIPLVPCSLVLNGTPAVFTLQYKVVNYFYICLNKTNIIVSNNLICFAVLRIDKSMYHALAYSSVMCIQALLKFEQVS